MIRGNRERLIRVAGCVVLICWLHSNLSFAQGTSEALEQGNRLLDAGRPQEAIPYFEQALERNPAHPEALRRMGQAQEWLGHIPEAIRYYRRATEAAPKSVESWFALGKLYSWQGNQAASYQAFETALSLAPENLEIELSYAEVLSWNPQRRQQSMLHYQNILQRSPDFTPAQVGLAQVQAWSGNVRQAERAYEAILDREPNQVGALLGKAEIARWTLRYLEAYELAQQAQRVAPNDSRVLAALAEAEILLGQYSLARQRAEELVSVAPNDSLRLKQEIRSQRRIYWETGYQLRRDLKSPVRNRLSADSFFSLLSSPLGSASRLELAFQPTIYLGENRRFSGNQYSLGVDWRLNTRWRSRMDFRAETYPGTPSNLGGRFWLYYQASDFTHASFSLERAVVSDSLQSEFGTVQDGIFVGQVRSNLATAALSSASFQRGLDFYTTFTGGFYEGRNLQRNWRSGLDGGFGKRLRSNAPYVRAGYGITFLSYQHDQSALPNTGVGPNQAGGYFSPKYFLNNFAVLSLSDKIGRRTEWSATGSLGVQQVEDRFAGLGTARLSSTFQGQLSFALTERFLLGFSYNFLNVGSAYQRNLFRISLRTYF